MFLSQSPGQHDVAGLDWFDFDLLARSQIVGDKADTDYELEEELKGADLHLLPMPKSNSTRPLPAWWRYLQDKWRKAGETTGRLLERLLSKSIHAVTPQGIELKVILLKVIQFVRAVSIDRHHITT